MRDGLERYSQQLRQMVDDYYHGQLTFPEYVAQRKAVLDRIEEELQLSSRIEPCGVDAAE